MNAGRSIGNIARPAVAAVLAISTLLIALRAVAAPEDDYLGGRRSYLSGDVVGAMSTLKRAADAGHAAAQALLADILDKAEFNEEAVGYYRKSAEQGNPEGQYGLGSMYASGEGIARDPEQARRWMVLAAEQGHAQAINVLAQAYIGGELGIDKKERTGETALRWIRKAAGNRYIPALEFLASAYRTGWFGMTDASEAERLDAQLKQARGNKNQATRRK